MGPNVAGCVLHKPALGDTLPVYVWDKYEEFSNVVPMVDLPDAAIDDYRPRERSHASWASTSDACCILRASATSRTTYLRAVISMQPAMIISRPRKYVAARSWWLEIDPVMIERAEKYLAGKADGRLTIVKGSVMGTDLPDNSFDFAIARFLIPFRVLRADIVPIHQQRVVTRIAIKSDQPARIGLLVHQR